MVKDLYVNQVVSACGVGSTENLPTFPKTVKCADLYVEPVDGCQGLQINSFCTQWLNRDENVCNGDYGGEEFLVN